MSDPNSAAALLESARDTVTTAQRDMSPHTATEAQARAHVTLALVAVARLTVELSCQMCSGTGLVLMRCVGADCPREGTQHRHHKPCPNPVHRPAT